MCVCGDGSVVMVVCKVMAVVVVIEVVVVVVVVKVCVDGISVCGYGSCDSVDSGMGVVIVTVCEVSVWGGG